MESTESVSSRHPGSGSAFTSHEWQRRDINPETCFDIVRPFREIDDVKWARKQFRKRKLLPLLQPAYDKIYLRLVRTFYQNLTFDSDQPSILSSTIDGIEIQFSVEDIAEALGCPCDSPSDRFGEFPSGMDLHAIINDMCEGEYADKKRNCTSKAKLPSKLICVRVNMCEGEFLAALYAFHKKYWFNAPQLIWRQMYKCWDELLDKRLPSAEKWGLPFPSLVTKLVLNKGVTLHRKAVISQNFLVFGLTQWNLSVSHMKKKKLAPEPDDDMEVDPADMPAADMAEGESSVRIEGPVPVSPTEFELLQAQLNRMEKRQEDFEKEMRDTLRELLSRLPPAPFAPSAPLAEPAPAP